MTNLLLFVLTANLDPMIHTSGANRITLLDIATWAGFMLFATSVVIVGVCLPEISCTFSVDLAEGGALETVRNILVLVVLLLAGVLANQWGKKRFLTLGQYLIAASFLLASSSQSYGMLIFSLMLLGVGGGFSEALLNPLIADVHKRESARFLNLASAFYSIGVVGAALLFGQFLTLGYSWRLLFQVAAAGALVVALLFSLLRFPPAGEKATAVPRLFANILALTGFWLYALVLFLGGGIESALIFWSRSYVDSYLSDVPRAGALAVVAFAGAMTIGRFLTAYLANRWHLITIMVVSAVLGAIASALIPFVASLVGFYTLLALTGLATACLWPSVLARADANLNANTTILFVLLAVVGIAGYGFTPWLIGLIGDTLGLRAGFTFVPLLFLLVTGILLMERRATAKRAGHPNRFGANGPARSGNPGDP